MALVSWPHLKSSKSAILLALLLVNEVAICIGIMVTSCAALGCKNRHRKGSGITFYSFPLMKEKLLQKWLKAVQRDNFQPTRNHLICSDHFDPSSFLPNYVNVRKLRDDAVPTLFNFPDLVKKTEKARPPPKKRKFTEKSDEIDETVTRVKSRPPQKMRKIIEISSDNEETIMPTKSRNLQKKREIFEKSDYFEETENDETENEETKNEETENEETKNKESENEETVIPVAYVDEHTYTMSASPSEVATKLNLVISRQREIIDHLRQNFENYRRKCIRKDKEISTLKALVTQLKSKEQKTATLLTSCLSDLQSELFYR